MNVAAGKPAAQRLHRAWATLMPSTTLTVGANPALWFFAAFCAIGFIPALILVIWTISPLQQVASILMVSKLLASWSPTGFLTLVVYGTAIITLWGE